MRHRRAYWPPLWPAWLLAAVLVLPVAALVHSLWIVVPWSIFVGVVVPSVRIAAWRRRHPAIRPDEYVTDYLRRMRSGAPWN